MSNHNTYVAEANASSDPHCLIMITEMYIKRKGEYWESLKHFRHRGENAAPISLARNAECQRPDYGLLQRLREQACSGATAKHKFWQASGENGQENSEFGVRYVATTLSSGNAAPNYVKKHANLVVNDSSTLK